MCVAVSLRHAMVLCSCRSGEVSSVGRLSTCSQHSNQSHQGYVLEQGERCLLME